MHIHQAPSGVSREEGRLAAATINKDKQPEREVRPLPALYGMQAPPLGGSSTHTTNPGTRRRTNHNTGPRSSMIAGGLGETLNTNRNAASSLLDSCS